MDQEISDGSDTTQDRNLTSGDEGAEASVLDSGNEYTSLDSSPLLHSQNMALDGRYLSSMLRLPPELLFTIFSMLEKTEDQWAFTLCCKTCFNLSIDGLWLRPSIQDTDTLLLLLRTLITPLGELYVPYPSMIRRLNLTAISEHITDALLLRCQACHNLERLTLSGCKSLTDNSLATIVANNPSIQSIDMSGVVLVTDKTLISMSGHCRKLQGLYASNCSRITSSGVITLGRNCPLLKRVKLTGCREVDSAAVELLFKRTTGVVELDLSGCDSVSNQSITNLLTNLCLLRELHLANNPNISDAAFLRIPPGVFLERLRVIDLASCSLITDASVGKLVELAPRLRNVVLAKCVNITDRGVEYLTRLERSLHHLHLGHCTNITDMGISALVKSCTKIEYIDLACCTELTNAAVKDLSTLPGLRRIGLVKCTQIDDDAIDALSERPWSDTLERVHLSYCNRISLVAIMKLVNACRSLTHLSLTGVPPFMRNDLTRFCRAPPPDFTQHQQSMFCVFSGRGVENLRMHLNLMDSEHDAMMNSDYGNDANGNDDENHVNLDWNQGLMISGGGVGGVGEGPRIAADMSPEVVTGASFPLPPPHGNNTLMDGGETPVLADTTGRPDHSDRSLGSLD